MEEPRPIAPQADEAEEEEEAEAPGRTFACLCAGRATGSISSPLEELARRRVCISVGTRLSPLLTLMMLLLLLLL